LSPGPTLPWGMESQLQCATEALNMIAFFLSNALAYHGR
jgi:hypothetical protein